MLEPCTTWLRPQAVTLNGWFDGAAELEGLNGFFRSVPVTDNIHSNEAWSNGPACCLHE